MQISLRNALKTEGEKVGNKISKFTVREALNRMLNSAEDGLKATAEVE